MLQACWTLPRKMNPANGRWYTTIGLPGFNTAANNSNGYATREAALRVYNRLKRADEARGNRQIGG